MDAKMTGFPEVLTPEQAAEYLQLPADVVLSYLEQRKIPGVKIGATWRIRRAMLDQWLDQQSLLTIEEQEPLPSQTIEPNRDEKVSIAQPIETNSKETIEKISVSPRVVQSPQLPEGRSENATNSTQEERLSSDGQTTTGDSPARSPSLEPPFTQKPPAQTPKRILGKVKTFNPKTGL